VHCGLILDKNRGLFAKWHGIFGFKLFLNGKRHGLSPWFMDHGRRWSTVDHRQGLGGGSLELSLAAALGHDGLPRGWPREGGDAARLGNCSPEERTSRWCGSVPSGRGSFYRAEGGAPGQ
jgi:hypothetical protein